MNDSQGSNTLAEKHERNRRERLEGIQRWVKYIRNHPPEMWGTQQNRLVNAQLKSARETGLSLEHEQRVRTFAEGLRDESPSDADEP